MDVETWIVDVEKIVDDMEDIPNELEQKKKRSIYRIPDYIRELNNKAFKPQVVSFGPYYHGEPNLKPMEEYKNRALLRFLKRSEKPLRQYFDSLAQEVKDLKDAYDQLDPEWLEDDKKFLQMMVLDGCFIVEILRQGLQNGYTHDDPIFSDHGMLNAVPLIERDMLLLENQVPLLVLEILVTVEGEDTMRTGDDDLIKSILSFFDLDTKSQSTDNGLHVLDVYRRTLLVEQPMPMDSKKQIIIGGYDVIPSATELHEAGIRFKKSKAKSLKDISFEGSTLYCPLIEVDDDTETIFLNLMAFERLHVGAGNDVISYVYFMSSLINNGRDTSLLRSLGIVHNNLGSDEDVAQLFKSISKDAMLDPQSELGIVYFMVIKKLKNRFRKRLSTWRMDLLQNYLKSPWGVVSVIGAIILFTLTTIQTVYTVLSYTNPKKN